MPLTGLHHVQVACPAGSEDALRAFYVEVLGMPEVAKPPALAARGGVWFRSAGAEIHCGVEEDFRPARKAHPAFLVRDLAGLSATLGGAGHQVRTEEPLEGHARVYVDDPFGNRIELMEPNAGLG